MHCDIKGNKQLKQLIKCHSKAIYRTHTAKRQRHILLLNMLHKWLLFKAFQTQEDTQVKEMSLCAWREGFGRLGLLESNQRGTTELWLERKTKELPPGRLLSFVNLLLNLSTVGAWLQCPRKDFRTGEGAQIYQLDWSSEYSSL